MIGNKKTLAALRVAASLGLASVAASLGMTATALAATPFSEGSVTLTAAADAMGTPSAPYTLNTFNASNSTIAMGWLKKTYTFTASGVTTKLSVSGSPNAGATGPALDNASIADVSLTSAPPDCSATSSNLVSDCGFETPVEGSGSGAYAYNLSGSPWTFSTLSGISGNESGFTSGNPSAPQGAQVAFLQAQGSIAQTITTFQSYTTYLLTFEAAQRGNYGGSNDFQVYLDNTLLGTYKPDGTTYAPLSTNTFTTSAGTHVLRFVGLNSAGGDDSALIDNISLTAQGTIPTPTTTATNTPTTTATNTPTTTATNTPAATATNTPTTTPTRTSTPLPPTATATLPPSATPTMVGGGGGALGGSGAATPELGSGELLATGLLPALALLLYRRRRARR